MSIETQQMVNAAVWPWRQPKLAADPALEASQRRMRATIQAAVGFVIGALLYWLFHKPVMGAVVWGISAFIWLAGLFVPPLFKAIETFFRKFAHWVGIGLTYGLLVPFYYLCFVPAHVILCLKGKDPMQRRFPSSEPTYWIPRPPVHDVSQYRKQF